MLARRKRHRILAAAIWMAVWALVLTGCATGAPDADDDGGTDAADTADAAEDTEDTDEGDAAEDGADAGEPASLRMFTYDDAGPAELLREQLAAFTEESGIEVTLDTLPGSGAAVYPDRLRTELLGGNAPDVWRIWGGEIGAPFARAGHTTDLGPYFEEFGWHEALNSNAVEQMTIDGAIYGVPVWSVGMGAWFNRQVFDDAGAEVPTTYAELEEANAALVEAGVTPLGTGGMFGWHIMRLYEYLLEVTAGPELHDQLLAGEASWNDPAVVEAFELFVKWQEQGWLPDGALGLDPADIEPSFVQGTTAYTISGPWAESNFIVGAEADPADFGTFVLPTGHDPNRYSGFVEGYVVAETSPNKDAAAQLIDFLLQPDVQRALNNGYSTVLDAPPDEDVLPNSAQWTEFQQEAPSYVIQDQAFPKGLADGYFGVQSDVLQGNITPQEAAEQMDALVGEWDRDAS